MDFHLWLAYFAAAWLIALSPGSGAVLTMSHGLAYGVRKTSATIAGLQVGLALTLLIAGVGVGAVLVTSAAAFMVVKALGAAYLVWLGWRQWRSRVAPAADMPAAETAAVDVGTAQRLLRGLLTNLTNPKGIVFMVAVVPQFIDPARPLWPQLLILLATTVFTDTIVMHGYAWLASRLRSLMRSARARAVQNRVFGGVLMGMGASLFFVRRSAMAGV